MLRTHQFEGYRCRILSPEATDRPIPVYPKDPEPEGDK